MAVFFIWVYHNSFDDYPQPIQFVEIWLQVDLFEAL